MTANEADREVCYRVAKIRESQDAPEKKYERLDVLLIWVMQNHPDGIAAKTAISTIDAAMTEVMRS
jgi:hypothetical protein